MTLRVFGITSIVLSVFSGCAGTPIPPGVGRLPGGSVPPPAPPPQAPNCVTSYVDPVRDSVHGAAPLRRVGETAAAQDRIRRIVEGEPRTEILTDIPGYLHAVQYSRLWKFPDDVEFWFPDDEPVVHFRSASRLGYGDLGVNRKRMNRIRRAFGE